MRRLWVTRVRLLRRTLATLALLPTILAADPAAFDALAARYLDEMPALQPVRGTDLGDHRFDDRLPDVSAAGRERLLAFTTDLLDELAAIDRGELDASRRIDAELLQHELEATRFELDELQEWAWNPLVYTGTAGSALYSLLARDYAPAETRIAAATARLNGMPAFFAAVRGQLDPARVPAVHAATALKQHNGLGSLIDGMLRPAAAGLSADLAAELDAAIATATAAAAEHAEWLEQTLLPAAAGNFRLGRERYDRKLAFGLNSPLGRGLIRYRAEREYADVREQMYEVAKTVYARLYPYTAFPDNADGTYKQAVIRAALEIAYADRPAADAVVATARDALDQSTRFVREKNLVRVPDEPLEIILMPEFRRGVAIAYCDAPGPLDRDQKTFYAVSPIPEDWTSEQTDSFLREYNLRSIHELTIHEAMPGHYLQLAHANRYPSTLRAVLQSGTFIEGWAVYAERLMVDAGYYENDPLMRLIHLKWYLRAVINAIIDQAIHVDEMSEEAAMRLMIEGGFQEEREAAGKWVRAQLTSAQLPTYFVGFQEHMDLRRDTEQRLGDDFNLRRYHDELLSYGSPPVRYVAALLESEGE